MQPHSSTPLVHETKGDVKPRAPLPTQETQSLSMEHDFMVRCSFIKKFKLVLSHAYMLIIVELIGTVYFIYGELLKRGFQQGGGHHKKLYLGWIQ